MLLHELLNTLHLNPRQDERWVILGSTPELYADLLHPATISYEFFASVDGLLLTEALSANHTATNQDPLAFLDGLIRPMKLGSSVVVLEWQADGPLTHGPGLDRRVKLGKLSRYLREAGFGRIKTLANQSNYYLVQAIKGPPRPHPMAGKFVEVADLNELARNGMKVVELFDKKIIVANTGKEIVAFAQKCPHADGQFDRGLLRGRNVICPVHFYIWNVCSGEPVNPDDEDVLPRYQVKVDYRRQKVLVALT